MDEIKVEQHKDSCGKKNSKEIRKENNRTRERGIVYDKREKTKK